MHLGIFLCSNGQGGNTATTTYYMGQVHFLLKIMSYIVLARKYRPQNFLQLKGQDVLVQTVSNAFFANKLHHAYLLTGIRGIGKTTTARIIAKTLNCNDITNENNIPVSCEKCDNCLSLQNGSHPDVIEFDAASNTGIDDIKIMLEGISYAPAIGKYRIFIIDEVHMLSTKAFNSLLKTLEEPPQNVVFIFATTEIQKVPITILSRCQKFVLAPLSLADMSLHLLEVAKKENISIESNAIDIISKKSGGSVRDALSILDQSSTMAKEKITIEDINQMLSIISGDDISQLFEAVVSGNVLSVIDNLKKIKMCGIDENSILEEFLEFIHLKIYDAIKNEEGYANLLRLWNIFLPATQELSYSFNKYSILEFIFIKAMHVYAMPSVENLANSISENKIAEILKEFPNSVVY